MSGIFLSYRRGDTAGWAGRLHDSLKALIPGVQIFMDVEDIPPGVRFADYIREAVGSCDALVALIGPSWVTATDGEGRRRLDNPDDFIRLEIVSALERDVRVIPTLVGGAAMPDRKVLPDALKPLCDRQNFEIADRVWEDSCKRLAEALKKLLVVSVSATHPSSGPPKRFRHWLAGSAVLLILAVALVAINLLGNQQGSSPDPKLDVSQPDTPKPPPEGSRTPKPQRQIPKAQEPPAAAEQQRAAISQPPPSPQPASASPIPQPAPPVAQSAPPNAQQPVSVLDLNIAGVWEVDPADAKELGDLRVARVVRDTNSLQFAVMNRGANADKKVELGKLRILDYDMIFEGAEGGGKFMVRLHRKQDSGLRWTMELHARDGTGTERVMASGWADQSADGRNWKGRLVITEDGRREAVILGMTLDAEGKTWTGFFGEDGSPLERVVYHKLSD
jgi:hypothetical protein